MYVLLAERGETLDWPMSLDAALDVVTKEFEAFFCFSTDFLEALEEEALIQLSSEEQEDVNNSFLEATEEEDLKAGFDTMDLTLLEIVSDSPCLVLLTSTEALTLLLISPVDGLDIDVLCSFAATGLFVTFPNPCALILGLL